MDCSREANWGGAEACGGEGMTRDGGEEARRDEGRG